MVNGKKSPVQLLTLGINCILMLLICLTGVCLAPVFWHIEELVSTLLAPVCWGKRNGARKVSSQWTLAWRKKVLTRSFSVCPTWPIVLDSESNFLKWKKGYGQILLSPWRTDGFDYTACVGLQFWWLLALEVLKQHKLIRKISPLGILFLNFRSLISWFRGDRDPVKSK